MQSGSAPPHKWRKSLRIPEYDYSQPGAYFVTVCSHERSMLFGHIDGGQTGLSPIGHAIVRCWTAIPSHFPGVEIDVSVVMPNHIHGIILITAVAQTTPAPPAPHSLSAIVGSFKAAVTREVNRGTAPVVQQIWQSGFYEHIIRDEKSLAQIRQYVVDNPLKWHLDRENPAGSSRDHVDAGWIGGKRS